VDDSIVFSSQNKHDDTLQAGADHMIHWTCNEHNEMAIKTIDTQELVVYFSKKVNQSIS